MQTHNVIGAEYSTNMFSFKNKEFVAEISELRGGNPLGQLYNDACDAGFVLVSALTGKKALFYLEHTQHDADGDVKYWSFVPTSATVRAYSELAQSFVTILND